MLAGGGGLESAADMALTATSTPAEITTAYRESCDYDLDGDVAKCKEFIRACRFILETSAAEFEAAGVRVHDDYRRIRELLEKAEAWRAIHDSTALTDRPGQVVRHVSFANCRE